MRKKREQRAPSNKTKTPRKATHCNKGKKNKETVGVNNQTNKSTNQGRRGQQLRKS